MTLIARYHVEAQTGVGFLLKQGHLLTIIDPQGEQTADLIAFGQANRKEWLSSGRSIDYNGTIYLTAGHVLYSNRSNPMFTIVEDTVGRHDFLFASCSPEMFRLQYGIEGDHPNCFENLERNLAPFGITGDMLPTPFNLFVNASILPSGEIKVAPSLSRPGSFIRLRAEMDLIVGLTACSAEVCNNGTCKPVDAEITT
ncbi:MAG TPA: urea carboxylase-associated family protein [Ktedonobacteraceae bacterium]|nr:urea carboxylase-associated family protein [Ktedonobacteraceae bacterium]